MGVRSPVEKTITKLKKEFTVATNAYRVSTGHTSHTKVIQSIGEFLNSFGGKQKFLRIKYPRYMYLNVITV